MPRPRASSLGESRLSQHITNICTAENYQTSIKKYRRFSRLERAKKIVHQISCKLQYTCSTNNPTPDAASKLFSWLNRADGIRSCHRTCSRQGLKNLDERSKEFSNRIPHSICLGIRGQRARNGIKIRLSKRNCSAVPRQISKSPGSN